jgi:hypothetical protein
MERKIFYRRTEAEVIENIGRLKSFGVFLAFNRTGLIPRGLLRNGDPKSSLRSVIPACF